MADDALASGQPQAETQETAPTAKETQTQTAEATQEVSTETTVPDKKIEEERIRFAEEYHRKKLNEVGYGVAKVPEQHRERLKQNPNLISELEAERDAFKRAALNGGQASGQVQPSAAPEKDDAAERAKSFLKKKGFTGKEDNYQDLLEYETDRERDIDERVARAVEKVKPDTSKLVTELGEAQRKALWQSEFEKLKQSPEWTDPETGPDFEGRFWRKCGEVGKTRDWASPAQLRDEIRAERAPKKKSVSVGKPSLGDGSSGRVAAGAGPDPFDSYREACRAAGKDPDKLGQA